jgi:hypothetical protein
VHTFFAMLVDNANAATIAGIAMAEVKLAVKVSASRCPGSRSETTCRRHAAGAVETQIGRVKKKRVDKE